MRVALRRDLRQVGDAQHLALRAQRAQLAADDLRDRAADARIDFVEHHGRHRVQAERGDLDRQRHAREFAARSDLAQRPRRLAGVRGNEEFHALGAVRIGIGAVRVRLQRDFETPAGHAQFADQARGLDRQRFRRLAPRGAERVRGLAPGRAFAIERLREFRQPPPGIAQRLVFGGQRLALRGEAVERHAVLAREVLQPRQPPFHRRERVRVEVEVGTDAFDQRRRFVELDRGRIEHRVDLGQARLVRGLALQGAAQALQLHRQRGLAAEAFAGVLAGRDQRRGVGLAAVPAVEFGQRFGIEGFRVEFVELVAQPVAAFAGIAACEQGGVFARQFAPARSVPAHLGDRPLVAGVGIEQVALRRPRQQRLLFVLAVDFEQQCGQFRDLRQRRRAAVDPGARTAVGAQRAPQLAFVAVVEFLRAQPVERGRGIVERELRGQLRAFGAVADHAAVGALAAEEAERIHQQGLAGAGFAGNHGQARTELQFDRGGDGEVAQGEAGEHGGIVEANTIPGAARDLLVSTSEKRVPRCARNDKIGLHPRAGGRISRAWPVPANPNGSTRARGNCCAR